LQSVKEVLQSLVDDGLVLSQNSMGVETIDKIGLIW